MFKFNARINQSLCSDKQCSVFVKFHVSVAYLNDNNNYY